MPEAQAIDSTTPNQAPTGLGALFDLEDAVLRLSSIEVLLRALVNENTLDPVALLPVSDMIEDVHSRATVAIELAHTQARELAERHAAELAAATARVAAGSAAEIERVHAIRDLLRAWALTALDRLDAPAMAPLPAEAGGGVQ